MANNGSDTASLTREGTLSLNEIQEKFSTASSSLVTVDDWGITYNSGTNQLSEYGTAVSTNPDNPITGIGMLAYSADGSVLYGAQYTNAISSPMVATSIGTTLYNPSQGNQALCVVYGWTEQGSFYLTQKMTIESN